MPTPRAITITSPMIGPPGHPLRRRQPFTRHQLQHADCPLIQNKAVLAIKNIKSCSNYIS